MLWQVVEGNGVFTFNRTIEELKYMNAKIANKIEILLIEP